MHLLIDANVEKKGIDKYRQSVQQKGPCSKLKYISLVSDADKCLCQKKMRANSNQEYLLPNHKWSYRKHFYQLATISFPAQEWTIRDDQNLRNFPKIWQVTDKKDNSGMKCLF